MSLEAEIQKLTAAITALTAAMQGQTAQQPRAEQEAVIKPPQVTLEHLRQECKKAASNDKTFTAKLSLMLKETYGVSSITALNADDIAEVCHHVTSGNLNYLPEPEPEPEKIKIPTHRLPVHHVEAVSERCIQLIRTGATSKAKLLEVLSQYNGAKTINQVPTDQLPELAAILDKIGKGEYDG